MAKPEFLKNPKQGTIFRYTRALAERGDMIPCDRKGKPLGGDWDMPEIEPFKMPDVIDSAVDGWGLGDTEKREVFESKLNEEIRKGNDEWERRNSIPYDGVMGILPDWVPKQDQIRFKMRSDLLLNQYSDEEIREYIELYPKYFEGKLGDVRFAQMQSECLHAIGYLVLIKNVIDSRPEEGIKMLAGEYAARGYAAHENSKRRAEKANKDKNKARNFCVESAAKFWEMEVAQGKPITRIGTVSELLWQKLADKGRWKPTTADKVREWLKNAHKKGELIIPEEAQKPGAPSK